jgi:hypothetical protein
MPFGCRLGMTNKFFHVHSKILELEELVEKSEFTTQIEMGGEVKPQK